MRNLSYYLMLLKTFLTFSKEKRQKIRSDYALFNDNSVVIFDNDKEERVYKSVKGLKIIFDKKSKNNVIKIHQNTKFTGGCITINGASNSYIEIGESEYINHLAISIGYGNNQRFIWGDGSKCIGALVSLHEENAQVIVGRNTLFSWGIVVWATDGHAIIDRKTKQVINDITKPVKIGDNCWIGNNATILKNANIPNNTIVGNSAVVTKEFEENYTILAGNPAKIIKHNMEWSRQTAFEYTKSFNINEKNEEFVNA